MANSVPGYAPGLLRKDSSQISLPDPTGPLSMKLDSATIQEDDRERFALYGMCS